MRNLAAVGWALPLSWWAQVAKRRIDLPKPRLFSVCQWWPASRQHLLLVTTSLCRGSVACGPGLAWPTAGRFAEAHSCVVACSAAANFASNQPCAGDGTALMASLDADQSHKAPARSGQLCCVGSAASTRHKKAKQQHSCRVARLKRAANRAPPVAPEQAAARRGCAAVQSPAWPSGHFPSDWTSWRGRGVSCVVAPRLGPANVSRRLASTCKMIPLERTPLVAQNCLPLSAS